MSDIPEDLIADVLSRLPVESLLRFRCVSKQWCALIDSPKFINLQRTQSLKTSTNLSVIFEYYDLFSVAFDYILKHDDHNNLPPAKLYYPLLKLGDFDIIGSCNGLICLESFSYETLILLNPSTKKYQLCPPVPSPSITCHLWQRVYEIGYDHVSDDYKVVGVTRYFDPFPSEVIVYSLRSNIWRRINYNFHHLLPCNTDGVFFNGALHWVATRQPDSRGDGFIVAFDLVDESCREVQLPNISGNRRVTLGVSGGCLFLICIGDHGIGDDDAIVELWVMKDYLVQESWTKLSIAFLSQLQLYKPICDLRILAFSNSSREVLLTQINESLCWLDLKEQKVADLDIRSHRVEICIASLVKLHCDLVTNVL